MTIYTVSGFTLDDCPIELLRKEAEAGRGLKASGAHDSGNWAKLTEVEKEIRRREHYNRHH